MLELFRKNLFFNALLLLPYCAVLRIKSFLFPFHYELQISDGYFNEVIFEFLGQFRYSSAILSVLLIFIQASIINYLVNKNRLLSPGSLIPGAIYILMISHIPQFLTLTPILISNTFCLIALLNLFRCYKNPNSTGKIFNAGFFLALSAFFYFPSVLFLISGYIALVIIRSFKMVEKMQYFSGMFSIVFLLLTWLFYHDLLSEFQTNFINNQLIFGILKWELNQMETLMLIGLVLLTIYVFFSYRILTMKKSIQAQKKIDISYWFMFFSFFTLVLWNGESLTQFQLFIPYLALLFGMQLHLFSNKLIAETIHLILLMLLVYFHFIQV